MIKVLFFAHLRDAAQTSEFSVEATGIESVRDLVALLSEKLPPSLGEALRDETAMVSVNQRYAEWDAPVEDDAEVGFLPPVSGG